VRSIRLTLVLLTYLRPGVCVFRINMELCRASDVMSPTVATIHSQENVAKLAKMLLTTEHSGFPVVKYDEETKAEIAYGLITRLVQYIL